VNDERGSDGLAVAFGDDQQNVLRHGRADAQEKVEIQVGRGKMRLVGVAVAAVEQAPVRLGDVGAAHAAQRDAGRGHLAPLGADVLALLVFERGEEFVEIAVSGVEPVELHAAAQQVAGIGQLPGLLLGDEQDVGR